MQQKNNSSLNSELYNWPVGLRSCCWQEVNAEWIVESLEDYLNIQRMEAFLLICFMFIVWIVCMMWRGLTRMRYKVFSWKVWLLFVAAQVWLVSYSLWKRGGTFESKDLDKVGKEQWETFGQHKAVLCRPQKEELVPLLYVRETVFFWDINR